MIAPLNIVNEMSLDDTNRLYAAATAWGTAADYAVTDGSVGAQTDEISAYRFFRDTAYEMLPMDIAELVTDCLVAALNRGNPGY